jgi:histidine ammonia-lyase
MARSKASEACDLRLPYFEGVIRRRVKHLDVDRLLYPDHNTMKALVKSGEI